MIDILIPVLGRPQNAAPLVENIRAVTTVPYRIIFLCSPGDEEQIAEVSRVGEEWTKSFVVGHAQLLLTQAVMNRPAGSGDFAYKINQGFLMGDNEFVFMGADDLTFEPRWDTTALKIAGDKYHVVATNDGANAQVMRGEFGTHCLIRRRYVTERGGTVDGGPGQVLCELYDHNFVDRELCHIAQHRGVFAFARHSRVKHRHPLWRTTDWDPTYRKALSNARHDQKLFLSRAHLWGYAGLSAHERKLAA